MAQSVIDLFQQLARNEFGFFERLQTVSEIMSINVPTVSSEVSVGEMIGRRDPLALGSMAVTSVAKGRLISVSPTARLADVLTRLAENGRDIVVVQDDTQIQGTISLTDIIRVFRTLMRLQSLKTM